MLNMKLSEAVLQKEQSIRLQSEKETALTLSASTRYAYEFLYANLPLWERTARTTAYAFDHQVIEIDDDDVVIGRYNLRVYDPAGDPGEHPRKTLEDSSWLYHLAYTELLEYISGNCPEVREDFLEIGLHGDAFWNGHESHSFQKVLRLGWQGIHDLSDRMLSNTQDQKKRQFYQGLNIVIDSLIRYNDRYVEMLEQKGMTGQAKICRQVPRYPARNFREAVQCVNMVYFTVTQDGNGTYGPGWLDYYLWPYLEKDLKEKKITMQEAFDLCGHLLLQMDRRIRLNEEMNDTVCLGGSHPNGEPAISPLTYLFAEAALQLDITCLLVYLKMPENPPEEFVSFAARYLIAGRNRGQILNDKAIAGSLEYRGVPYEEALSYTTNGCMEVSCSQSNSDMLLSGWHNIPKFVELSITGNYCLINRKTYAAAKYTGLSSFRSFEEYYTDFLCETRRILHQYFDCIDTWSTFSARYRPSYYASCLLNDCMIKGRNMHEGGTRYHDYGTAPVGLGMAADSLFAVKKAVFDDRICSAQELIDALKHNYEGNEVLRLRLKAYPKYGQDNEEADAFTSRFFNDICSIYESYENHLGGGVKPVIFTFVWAGICASHLGATAAGNYAHTPASHGTTPAGSSMTKGVTAAILSNCKMPMHRFTGGGSSMWDFDESWINRELMESFLKTFLSLGGQMFQGNSSVDPQTLKKAQETPGDYLHLIVRVGGFSAHFVDLDKSVQDDIISRCRHQV